MSSSHLFLGLPIALLVVYFELSSGFHSAAFINHLSLGDVAILIASLHFIFLSHVPAPYLLIFHLFHGFVGALLMYSRLQSLQRQPLRFCRSRITRRCPGHCERQSFFRLHSRRLCSSSQCCFCLRWS